MKQRIAQLISELEEHPWRFSGPEERNCLLRTLKLMAELEERVRAIEKRWEETD